MEYEITNIVPNQVLQRSRSDDKASLKMPGGNLVHYKTGGPYFHEKKGPFYVGDIWIMAGQKNMEGWGFKVDPFTKRRLEVPVENNTTFLYDLSGNWNKFDHDCLRKTFKVRDDEYDTFPMPVAGHQHLQELRGATLAPSFANTYNAINPHVPLGIVACARDRSSLDDLLDVPNSSSSVFHCLILDKIKEVGGNIAGVLWYQGGSDATNTRRADNYHAHLQKWLIRLRKATERPELPVVIVQIGAHHFKSPGYKENRRKIQDAQRKLFDSSPFTAGVASLDAELDDEICLSAAGLSIVGRRMALAADMAIRGIGDKACPLPSHAFRQRLTCSHGSDCADLMAIYLDFNHLNSPWDLKSEQPVLGFELNTDAISVVKALVANRETGTVCLYLSKSTDAPLTISYGMQIGLANLITKDGIALPAFQKFSI